MNYPNLRESWIKGDVRQSSLPVGTKELYKCAIERFVRDGTQDERKIAFAQTAACLQDVESLVIRAKKDYESSRNQRLNKWLGRVSSRLMYYGNIFDVLAQHHPEYVALAWGAMKFLFVAVMNHEHAIASLAKGISSIADALPRVELATLLYPTKKMMHAVEELYAYILRFFIRAHDWYREGTLRHILHSIIRPAELRYQDLLENIASCSRNIDQLAVSGSQVELREVHESLKAVTSQLERSEGVMQEMKAMMINHQAINSSSLIDTNQRITDLQFSEMVRVVSSVPLSDPMESFRHGLLMRKRRQIQNKIDIPQAFWKSSALQSFSSSQSSSLVLVKGNFRSRFSLRDAAVIITEELHQKNVPVLWAVRTVTQHSSTDRVSPSDVVKSLVAQALRLSSPSHSQKLVALSCARLQTASTEAEWFQVLASALEGLCREIYIMLDFDILMRPSREELVGTQILDLFFDLFQELSKKGLGHRVKVMIFTYGPSSPQNIRREGFTQAFLSASPTVRPIHRARYHKYLRNSRNSRNSRNNG